MTNEIIHWNFLPTVSFYTKGVATPYEYLVECYRKTLVVCQFYCMAFFLLRDATSCDKKHLPWITRLIKRDYEKI